MTRALAFAALLIAGGCTLSNPFAGPPIPPEEDTPQHRACRSESRNAPEVRDLNRQMNAANTFNEDRLAGEIRLAQQRAYRDCLRRAGIGAPGGVEAVRAPPRGN